MQFTNVLRNLPPPHPLFQIKIHAKSLSHQPHVRTNVNRSNPLLHASRLTLKNESNLQDLQLTHHKPMYNLLSIQQKSLIPIP